MVDSIVLYKKGKYGLTLDRVNMGKYTEYNIVEHHRSRKKHYMVGCPVFKNCHSGFIWRNVVKLDEVFDIVNSMGEWNEASNSS